MFTRLIGAAAGLAAAVTLGAAGSTGPVGPGSAAASGQPAPSVAGAPAGTGSESPLHRWCAQRMHDAVVEDNDAYEARDAERYEAVLHPDMLFVQDGDVTYGRDAIMETARHTFSVPGWHWSTEILSETTYGCSSGVAVLTASMATAEKTTNYHVTMTMTQNRGKWTVAMDSVHLIDTVYH